MPLPEYRIVESRDFRHRADALHVAFSDVYFRRGCDTPLLQFRFALGNAVLTREVCGLAYLAELTDIGVHAWEYPLCVGRKLHFPIPPGGPRTSIFFDFCYDGETEVLIRRCQSPAGSSETVYGEWRYHLHRKHIARAFHEAVWRCYDSNHQVLREAAENAESGGWGDAWLDLIRFIERKLAYFDSLLSGS